MNRPCRNSCVNFQSHGVCFHSQSMHIHVHAMLVFIRVMKFSAAHRCVCCIIESTSWELGSFDQVVWYTCNLHVHVHVHVCTCTCICYIIATYLVTSENCFAIVHVQLTVNVNQFGPVTSSSSWWLSIYFSCEIVVSLGIQCTFYMYMWGTYWVEFPCSLG